MRGLGRHYELSVGCRCEPDPVLGYEVNIKDVDRAVRDGAIPMIASACAGEGTGGAGGADEPAKLLGAILAAGDAALPVEVSEVRWQMTPYASVEMSRDDRTSVVFRQQYELAASHRLHVDAWSAEKNREAFGKCNYESGHGHNYVFEPAIRAGVSDEGRSGIAGATLDRIVDEAIIQTYDHRYLNEIAPFAAEGGEAGMNPSVENIARVFYERLHDALRDAAPGAELVEMTVWETDRTSAVYPG